MMHGIADALRRTPSALRPPTKPTTTQPSEVVVSARRSSDVSNDELLIQEELLIARLSAESQRFQAENQALRAELKARDKLDTQWVRHDRIKPSPRPQPCGVDLSRTTPLPIDPIPLF